MEPMVSYQAPPSPSTPLRTIRLLCGHVGEVRLGFSSEVALGSLSPGKKPRGVSRLEIQSPAAGGICIVRSQGPGRRWQS